MHSAPRHRRWLLAAAVALLLVGVALAVPKVRLAGLYALGRSPHCPWPNAIGSAAHWRDIERRKDAILAASRKIETDREGFRLWQTPHGRFWVPEGSDYVLPFNLAEQESDIYGGPTGIRAGDIVLDCGANVGVYTRKALDAGARLVVAIEPSPANLTCLRRSFAADLIAGRVILAPLGVWDKEDTLTIKTVARNSAADTFVLNQPGATDGVPVRLTTIDRLVAELKLDRVDLIKMDIEGAETNAIAGARGTIDRFHPRLALSAYHLPTDPERIPPLVRAGWSGYQTACGPCASTGTSIRPDVLYFW